MQKNTWVMLYSVMLLLVIPGITLSDVFAEKLLVSEGFENTIQISGLDKTNGIETQLFSDDSFMLNIGSMDFSIDDFLISSVNEEDANGLFFYEISFIIEDGLPSLVASNVNENMPEISCDGLSFTPDGILYCMNSDGLSEINFELETVTSLGNPVLEGSEGRGLAVDSDGTIYIGDEIGLYTFDLYEGTTTQIVKWDNNNDGEIDEPNVDEGDVLGYAAESCILNSMDFDSDGTLYATMICDEEEPVLVKIVLDPITVVPPGPPQANITLFLLERNEDLFDIYELDDMFLTDAISFSPFDFDFLLGNTYGEVIEGFDAITATIDEGVNVISSTDSASITLCDNTALSMDAESELIADGCDTTSISDVIGTIEAIFTPNNVEVPLLTTTLVDGDGVIFDSAACTLTNTGGNDIEILFEDPEVPIPIASGETFECVKIIDHYLGYDAKVVHHNDDDDDDYDDDDYSNYDEYLTYFEEHNSDKYEKFLNKYGENDKGNSKIFKYAKKYYDKYHEDDKIQVKLVDVFAGEVNYEVKKVKGLYNPVDKNNEGIQSEESHLVEYKIKKLKGEPKFEKIKNIIVTNQFGETKVAIKKDAKSLLVPSSKAHDATPDELEDILINHFKCYDTRNYNFEPKWEKKRTVDLIDQFGEMSMELKKPRQLCSPVDKNDEGIETEENYLLCYDLKKIKGEPKFKKINVFTNNQFAPEDLEVKNPKKLCVPSEVVLP